MNRAIRKAAALMVVVIFVVSSLYLAPVQAAALDVETKNGSVWYVSQSGSGADGTSWETAYPNLQTALGAAASGDQIWVAAGVYTPGLDRTDRFNLVTGVALYGGFAGTETSLDERDWADNPTILSGDIGRDDINTDGNYIAETPDDIIGDNSDHVVYADGTTGTPITSTTILDGFTITAGQANGSYPDSGGGGMFCDGRGSGSACSPHLENLSFIGNTASQHGGAMLNNGREGVSSPSLENVTFSGNTANQGGAMVNDGYQGVSNPTLVNVVFFGNQSSMEGGALVNYGDSSGVSSPSLVNVTFSQNHSGSLGGAIWNVGYVGYLGISSPNLENVILWGNTAGAGSQICNLNANPTITNSLIEGGLTGAEIYNVGTSTVTDGGGNLDDDPLFVDAANGDLRLQFDSPAIDSGTNAAVTASFDLDGNPRLVDGDWDGTVTVDMGAYEFDLCPSGTVIYVDKDASGLIDGKSWNTAYQSLNDGLNAAAQCAGISQVWTAEGVYTPGSDRTDRFNLVPGVALYGGFAGIETGLDERDWTANPTILSGDIGRDDINTDGNQIAEMPDDIIGDNSYHVVFADGTMGTPITSTTILDGFTITAGQANGSYPDSGGGGMFCDGRNSGSACSPHLENLSFIGNTASEHGGAMVNDGYQGVSSPSLENVTFSGNTANQGGAMVNNGFLGISSPSLENVVFYGNQSSMEGGALVNYGFNGVSSPSLVNVTFSQNHSGARGGAIWNYISSPNLTNVILWGNTAGAGSQVYNWDANPTITNSLVEGGLTGAEIYNVGTSIVTDGGGNLDDAPLFADAANGDLRLQFGSPAIDSGTNAAVTALFDLDGNPRLVDGNGDGTATVDMGAYENQIVGKRLYLPLVIR